jgi:hypothetical protein
MLTRSRFPTLTADALRTPPNTSSRLCQCVVFAGALRLAAPGVGPGIVAPRRESGAERKSSDDISGFCLSEWRRVGAGINEQSQNPIEVVNMYAFPTSCCNVHGFAHHPAITINMSLHKVHWQPGRV